MPSLRIIRDIKVRAIGGSFALVVIAFLTAECLLRFVMGLGNPVLIQRDSSCEYLLRPDQNIHRFFHAIHINHYGMRSGDVPLKPGTGTMRLLFVGDSITYGTGRVDQEDLFTERVLAYLQERLQSRVEVLNASASGWAPDNELGYLHSRGLFGSRIVFVILNSGDLIQPRATIEEVRDDLYLERPATALGEVYLRGVRPAIAAVIKATSGRSKLGENQTASVESQIVRGNLADLDRIYELVEGNQAALVMVYVPFRKDIPVVSERSSVLLREWCRVNSVAMIDTTAAEAARSLSDITLSDGIHLSAAGHSIVADAIEHWWASAGEDEYARGPGATSRIDRLP